jgi:hypothetical protein
MIYILSCIIHKFFYPAGVGAVDQHFYLALFRADHHGLSAHPTDHIKRIHRTTPKRKLQHVFRHALFQRLFQVVGDLEKPVGRAQSADALVGALVVVILHPEGGALLGLLEAVELDALQKLVEDRLPEPLDLAKGHGMMRTGTDMFDPVFFHLPLEPGFASPVRVLPAVVGEHFPGHTVFSNPTPVALQNVFGGLAAVKPQGGDVAAVVVHEADQVGVLAGQPKGHDVALPQLVRTGTFEKPRFGEVFRRLFLGLVHQPLGRQGLVDGGLAGADQEKPLEYVGYSSRSILRVLFFKVDYPLPNFSRLPGTAAGVPLRFQPLGALAAIGPDPAMDGMAADAELLSKHLGAVAFLQEKQHHSQPELDRVGQRSSRPLGTGRTALRSLFHGSHSFLCNWFLHSGVSPHFLRLAVP